MNKKNISKKITSIILIVTLVFLVRICFRAVYGGTGSKKEGREGKSDAF